MRALSCASGELNTWRSTAATSRLTWACGRGSAWTAWWWSTCCAAATTTLPSSSPNRVGSRCVSVLHINQTYDYFINEGTTTQIKCTASEKETVCAYWLCLCFFFFFSIYNSTYLRISQDLVNIEMFLTAKEVEESLERQETATCLAWCHDNKSRLRKMKVTLWCLVFFFL